MNFAYPESDIEDKYRKSQFSFESPEDRDLVAKSAEYKNIENGSSAYRSPVQQLAYQSGAGQGNALGKTAGSAGTYLALSATGAGAPLAGTLAGAQLVGGLMEDRARREQEDIANELIRRKNLANAYEMQGTSLSNALQRNQDVLARALL